MRKLIAATGAVVVVMAMVAVPGDATKSAGGKAPRLDGTFSVTGAVRDNDIGIPEGSEVSDTFVFKSTCRSGACKRVGLTRKSGGRNVRSTLRMKKPGVYEGNEGPKPYTCVNPIGQPGEFTGHNTIKVTKSKNGKATKIVAQSKQQLTGCKETFENVDLRGTKIQG